MRLHASYLTLGTLLPDHSSSSKKKWCAPSIIDRAVTYIPKLQNEVEELTLKKQELAEAIESKRSRELEQRSPSIHTISVHELEGSGNEAVVQICTKNEKAEEFSNLLHVLEVQGFSILSASTTQVCRGQKVVCYHFHVKMDEKPSGGDDYITMLKKNIISSLS
uniref:Transcription factor ORG2 n=1 Tax=Noccaea caerulescens TaxID=107243 RepID=A0A1J3GF49_NOCCA